jgi:voltage-gated potassium channel Kch
MLRGTSKALVWVAVAISGLCAITFIAAWRDHAAIHARQGRAVAVVLDVSTMRTLVRYTTPDGRVHTPQTGVYYPGGLRPGQRVRVSYDRAHPDHVTVAGRGLRMAILPLGGAVVATWAVLGTGAYVLRKRAGAGRK